MKSVSLSVAISRLNELVGFVEAGESIEVTQHGKPVARLVAIETPRRRIDASLLQALTAPMPVQLESAADLVRSMRDGDRV